MAPKVKPSSDFRQSLRAQLNAQNTKNDIDVLRNVCYALHRRFAFVFEGLAVCIEQTRKVFTSH